MIAIGKFLKSVNGNPLSQDLSLVQRLSLDQCPEKNNSKQEITKMWSPVFCDVTNSKSASL